MSIIDYLSEIMIDEPYLTEEDGIEEEVPAEDSPEDDMVDEPEEGIEEEEPNDNGGAQEIVDTLLRVASDQKEQIGVILKYAANSDVNPNIWDEAYAYYQEVKDKAPQEDSTDTDDISDDAEPSIEDDNVSDDGTSGDDIEL